MVAVWTLKVSAISLTGIEQPFQLYHVIQPSGVRGRLEAAAATRGLTPFVGREDELRLLMSSWERALGGDGRGAHRNPMSTPAHAEWRDELKLDGFRAIARKAGWTTQLWSRNQKDFTRRFPDVVKAVAKLP